MVEISGENRQKLIKHLENMISRTLRRREKVTTLDYQRREFYSGTLAALDWWMSFLTKPVRRQRQSIRTWRPKSMFLNVLNREIEKTANAIERFEHELDTTPYSDRHHGLHVNISYNRGVQAATEAVRDTAEEILKRRKS